jgi:putative transposase
MIVGHRIQLLPNDAQEAFFRQACGIARHTWNWALTEWERQSRNRNPRIVDNYGDVVGYEKRKPVDDFGSLLPPISGIGLKKEFLALIDTQWPWMRVAPSHVYHQPFNDLSMAWNRCYKGLSESPVKKHKGKARDSFYLANTCIQVEGRHVKIAKLGNVRMREDLRFSGKIMSARVSRDADRWFISIAVEIPDQQPVHKQPNVAVGVDLGVAVMAALSTGEMHENPKARERHERKLKGLQRKLSRQIEQAKIKAGIPKNKPIPRGTKIEVSQRMLETKRRIQRAHQDISGIRSNAQHQLTAELTKRFGVIAIEDLRLQNMTASARGDAENPGKQVAQKAGLNRSLLNVGMHEIRRQLEYKAQRAGAVVIPVNPQYTSQTCSACGVVDKASRQSQSEFVCMACGHTANADHNAARNILAAGLARQAEGIAAKEIKLVGKLNPTRKKNPAQAESTADAAGYARGEMSLEDHSLNRERERGIAAIVSGSHTATHSHLTRRVVEQASFAF